MKGVWCYELFRGIVLKNHFFVVGTSERKAAFLLAHLTYRLPPVIDYGSLCTSQTILHLPKLRSYSSLLFISTTH